MWSMPFDRCSPAFSVREIFFQKVTNWSALVPGISSEQRDLWPFRLLDVVWMQWNMWSGISLWVVQGPQNAEIWHYIDDFSLLQKCQFCMLAMYNGPYQAENDLVQLWKIEVWDHSDHQFWTPYMWSMPLDRCSPAFSMRDKIFHNVTNWSALVPGISSEQCDLWRFRSLDVVWMQWN